MGRSAGRLNDKNVFAANVCIKLNGNFSIAKLGDAGAAQRHPDVSGDVRREIAVRIARKNH